MGMMKSSGLFFFGGFGAAGAATGAWAEADGWGAASGVWTGAEGWGAAAVCRAPHWVQKAAPSARAAPQCGQYFTTYLSLSS